MIRITSYRPKRRLTVEEFLSIRIEAPQDPQLPEELGEHLDRVCKLHRVRPYEVMGKARDDHIVKARRDFMSIMHFKLRFYPTEIAEIMKMDVSTVKYHLGLRKTSKVKYDRLKSMFL